MYNFLKDEDILQSRDPEWGSWSDEPRRDYLLPQDVALTEAEDPYLKWLALDTGDSKSCLSDGVNKCQTCR